MVVLQLEQFRQPAVHQVMLLLEVPEVRLLLDL
jgi:hypothetical protein